MPRHTAAALGTLATSVLLGGVAEAGEHVVAPPPRRIRLEIIRATPVTDEALAVATGETAAIWAPHGVTVLPVAAPAPGEPAADVTIKVLLRDAPANRIDGRTASGYRALASLVFAGPTEPGGVMFVSLEAARQTVRAAKLVRWPPAVQERLAARLLGRAIAHELGHYLLRSREHSDTGLMRAALDRRDVLTDGVARFGLEPDQAAALEGRRIGPGRARPSRASPGAAPERRQSEASATAALETNPIIISSVDSSPNRTVCVESKP
jgi:hypothetical protein